MNSNDNTRMVYLGIMNIKMLRSNEKRSFDDLIMQLQHGGVMNDRGVPVCNSTIVQRHSLWQSRCYLLSRVSYVNLSYLFSKVQVQNFSFEVVMLGNEIFCEVGEYSRVKRRKRRIAKNNYYYVVFYYLFLQHNNNKIII